MTLRVLTTLLLSGLALAVWGQAPVITDVSPNNTYATASVLIKGSGFSNSKDQLQVWFGHVKGKIISASTVAIEVEVPPQAQLRNIEVINLSTGLSGKSLVKFMPSFSGDAFNPEFTRWNLNSSNQINDLCSCDLNDDGKPDIVVTKNLHGELVTLRNQSSLGSLSFSSSLVSLPNIYTEHASCGDLDGDGKPDIVVSKRNPTPRNSIHILKNNSAAGAAITLNLSLDLYIQELGFSSRTIIRDLNGDGKPEIIVTDTYSGNKGLYIFVNTWKTPGVMEFNPTPIKLNIPSNETYAIDVQDLNGDNLPDIVISQFQKPNLYIFKNQSSNGVISFPGDPQVISLSGAITKIATAYFNNDLLPDLVVTATTPNNLVHVLINQSNTNSFAFSTKTYQTDAGAWGVDVADVDGDSYPDFVVGCISTNKLNVFLHNKNSAAPEFTKATVATTLYPRNVVAGDFDGDGKPDFAFTSQTGSTSFSLDVLRNKTCFKPKLLNEGTLCAGVTLRTVPALGASVSYTWIKDGSGSPPTTEPSFQTTSKGVYAVKATTEGGTCQIDSDKVDVLDGPTPVATITAAPAGPVYCAGSSLLLSGPVGSYRYEWIKPDGTTSSEANITIASLTPQHAGTYKLRIAAGSCTSDYSTKTIEVVSLDDFTISSPSTLICQAGGSVTLSVDAGYVYQWKKDNNPIGGAVNNTYTATSAGAYSVSVSSAACAGGGKETAPVNVRSVAVPVSQFQVGEPRCANSDIAFTSTSTVDPAATPKYTWAWGDNQTSVVATPATTHKYITAKDYTVALTVSYEGVNGCAHQSSQVITVKNSIVPEVNLGAQKICPGEETTVSVTGSFASISWSTGGSGSSTTIDQPGDYTVTTVDAEGCRITKEFNLMSKPVPEIVSLAASGGVEKPVAPGDRVQLTVEIPEGHNYNYVWEPDDGSLSGINEQNPVATPVKTTTYKVTATLNAECSASADIIIRVDEASCTLSPPVAFSPNADARYDTWVIDGIDQYSECTMTIFDARGKRVYQVKGYTNPWDGTYQGKPVPSGTYYYVMGCPDKRTCSGSVLVFR